MSLFRAAPFGLDAVNVVTGELVVAGSTVLAGSTTIIGFNPTFGTIPPNVNIVLLALTVGTTRANLPAVADVPVGNTITFKDSIGSLLPGPIGTTELRLDAADGIDDPAIPNSVYINTAWQSATFYSNGSQWNIIKYYDGSKST